MYSLFPALSAFYDLRFFSSQPVLTTSVVVLSLILLWGILSYLRFLWYHYVYRARVLLGLFEELGGNHRVYYVYKDRYRQFPWLLPCNFVVLSPHGVYAIDFSLTKRKDVCFLYSYKHFPQEGSIPDRIEAVNVYLVGSWIAEDCSWVLGVQEVRELEDKFDQALYRIKEKGKV